MMIPPEVFDAIRTDLDEDGFNAAALVLFHYQAKCNPIYRQYIRYLKVDPDEVTDWRSIPALPVSAFRGARVACFPPIETRVVFRTSGTTGTETGAHEFSSLKTYDLSARLWFEAKMPDVANHQWMSLIPSADDRPDSSLSHMVSMLGRKVCAGLVDTFCDADYHFEPEVILEQIIFRAETGKPLFLLGTSFAYVHLFESMMENRIETCLPEGSILFDTGGYKGRTRQYTVQDFLELAEECLRVQPSTIWNEYGMTELSSQAYTSMDVQRHVFPPWARYRIINPATGELCRPGEKGLVEIIDLANVSSVLCVSTQDAGIHHANGLELCGRIDPESIRGCSLSYE